MTSIYVGHLSFTATEDDLRKAFQQYGDVDSVSIITDRATGEPRGFAFVEMDDQDEAADAIKQLDGTEIGGRKVKVNEARAKEERPRRRGGRHERR